MLVSFVLVGMSLCYCPYILFLYTHLFYQLATHAHTTLPDSVILFLYSLMSYHLHIHTHNVCKHDVSIVVSLFIPHIRLSCMHTQRLQEGYFYSCVLSCFFLFISWTGIHTQCRLMSQACVGICKVTHSSVGIVVLRMNYMTFFFSINISVFLPRA